MESEVYGKSLLSLESIITVLKKKLKNRENYKLIKSLDKRGSNSRKVFIKKEINQYVMSSVRCIYIYIYIQMLPQIYLLENTSHIEKRKPNESPFYIDANSNHPLNILEQLLTMAKIRLLSLSINEDEFNKAKPFYEKDLTSSGFNKNGKFEYIQTKPSRNRKQKMVWFNPPYNAQVKTNIGKVLLKLARKHFQNHHRCKKIFNTNSIKLSY